MTRVLVLNVGSSSVKYEVIEPATGARAHAGLVEEVVDHEAALHHVVAGLGRLDVDVVGHRVVHGGEAFTEPTVIDDTVVAALRALSPLAPLHNPANLAGIELARQIWPDVAHVAVFDTAFHRTIPPAAYRYAVPAGWYEDYGVRRYGFHGTSKAYVTSRAAAALGRRPAEVDLIVAHLGNGASITAVRAGRSVETSMGFTPLEGLVMGTRSGDVDPLVVAHVAAASGRPAVDVIDDLSRSSGLLGLAGTSDMRALVERSGAGDADARLAIDVFAHRAKKYVGAYLAVLGRCDAVVFTGGIGERSPLVRAAIVGGLDGLGISIDPARNEAATSGTGAVIVSPPGSPVAVMVVATDEAHEIALEAAAALEAR